MQFCVTKRKFNLKPSIKPVLFTPQHGLIPLHGAEV